MTLRLPSLFPPTSLPAHTLGVVRGEEDRSGAETPLSGRIRTCDRAAPPSPGGGRSLEKGAELGPAAWL